ERDRIDSGGASRRRRRTRARGHERESLPMRRLSWDRRGRARCTERARTGKAEERGMKTFDYVRPVTIAEAIAAGAMPGAAYLAAGTSLLDLMKGGAARPDRLVDITQLPGLDSVERLPDGSLRIGALVRNADLAHDPSFVRTYPALAEALLSGASAQLRNAAT